MTLIDTNVLLDVLTGDARWLPWSNAQLDAAAVRGDLIINDVVFAELSVGYRTIEALEAVLAEVRLIVAPMPRAALFLAAKVFQRYRASGGSRTGVLPDFFIGAHAATMGVPLLTRDARRYRTYFPRLELVTPTDE